MTPEDFQARLLSDELEQILDEVLLAEEAVHVSAEQRAMLEKSIREAYSVSATYLTLYIVGSSKLGFSISEKRLIDGRILPRYRLYRAESDIDVAVVSKAIFEILWDELSIHAHSHARIPWDSGRLGDYMVYGWLRPDHFPRGVRLRRCDNWWDLFRRLSSDSRLGRRAVRGGLFHSVDHMRRYQLRALRECRLALEAAI
jgi:hypothetical protein